MSADVVLIGCTKAKRTTRSAARDLYDPSDLFRRRRAHAEATGRPWAILSALYGVIEPERLVDPYDFTIAQRRTSDRAPRGWAIGALQECFRLAGRTAELVDGRRVYVEPLTIEVHAGIDYVRTLELGLVAFSTAITIEHPVAGLGIGEQKRHYAPVVTGAAHQLELVLA